MNYNERTGKQIRRPQAVNTIKRKRSESILLDEDACEGCGRKFRPTTKSTRIGTGQTITLLTDLTGRSKLLVAVAATAQMTSDRDTNSPFPEIVQCRMPLGADSFENSKIRLRPPK